MIYMHILYISFAAENAERKRGRDGERDGGWEERIATV
jgi:hypothetical protein